MEATAAKDSKRMPTSFHQQNKFKANRVAHLTWAGSHLMEALARACACHMAIKPETVRVRLLLTPNITSLTSNTHPPQP